METRVDVWDQKEVREIYVQVARVNENKILQSQQLKLKSRTCLRMPRVNTFKIKTSEHAINAIDLTAQVLDVHR